MKNLVITTVFSIVSVVTAQALASDIEDYAGLPLYEEGIITTPEEIVVNENHTGYDGLPVTRLVKPAFHSDPEKTEFSAFEQEGYDGLPLVETESQGTLTIKD